MIRTMTLCLPFQEMAVAHMTSSIVDEKAGLSESHANKHESWEAGSQPHTYGSNISHLSLFL